MIISRAPLRVSLAGGGSDLPAYYESNDGEVYSFAINKYVYIALHHHRPGGFRLKYSSLEDVDLVQQIRHPLIREALLELNVEHPLEIASFADIPSSGSGLGSSSAFTVALLNAVSRFYGKHLTSEDLARSACKVEIQRCNSLIGKQDQYASAFGGLNHYTFRKDGTTEVKSSLNTSKDKVFLESCLSLFYLGFGRDASTILKNQSSSIKSSPLARETVDSLKMLVPVTKEAVQTQSPELLGEAISLGWDLKRKLDDNIANEFIEKNIERAQALGIYGAKVVGAGGGGFLLICHKPTEREKLIAGLSNLSFLDFQISLTGAEIVYQDARTKGTRK